MESVISKLIEAAVSFLQKKWKTISTAKKELDDLVEKLEAIKPIVQEAESLPFFKQKKVKSWIIKLKGVLYDTEDMIEKYRYEEPLEEDRCSSPRRRKNVTRLSKLGDGIKKINEQLGKLIDDFKGHKELESSLCGTDNGSAIADRNTTSALDEIGMVGREGDKEKLIQQLQQQGGGDVNSIVAIVGKGGLGKTFLAQMIFNDRQVKEHFADGVWWVCVSEKPNPNDMAKKLLEAIYKKDASDGAKDLENLCSKLRDAIKDKRFLLVLDDVWDLDWWEKLKLHLQGGAPGSKFLITSRKKKLMKSLEHNCAVFVHDLRGFTGEESRKLFIKQIGKTEAALRNEGKLEIGERILKKCGDLPLVIKTVGSLLRTKETAAQWENVEKSAIWSWKEEDDGEGVLLPGLVLSYDDLQAHLKNCFVYCSLFPKDFKMEEDMLAQQWIAHGFVKEKEGIDIEESAKNCLNELVNRCLLEEGHADLEDRFLRMHDVIHDLALYIGGEEYSLDSVEKNARHLSLIGEDQDAPSLDGQKFENSKLRTLLCDKELPSKVVRRSEGLRVLRMGGLSDESSRYLDKLLHLRYLDLSSSHVKSMCTLHNLPFLRTLRLSFCDSIKWLPSLPKVEVMDLNKLESLEGWSSEGGKAVKLPCLRTLQISRCKNIKRLPSLPEVKVMKLMNLQSLKGLSSTEDGETVMLSCLKTLEVSYCGNIKRLPSLPKVEVMKLVNLQSLNGLSSTEDGETVILPCLKTLEVRWCGKIKLLPSLPKVEVMTLEQLKSLEGWSSAEDGKAVILPCLRTLEIYNCSNIKWLPSLPNVKVMMLKELSSLEGWSSTEDGKAVILSCLMTLEISHCSNMKWLPSLPKVEVMELYNLPSLEGWSSTDDGKAAILPCLKKLQISWCVKIKWLPFLPKVEVMKLKGLYTLEGWSSIEDGKAEILSRLRSLVISEYSNIKVLNHFHTVVQGLQTLDVRFYANCIGAESVNECRLMLLNGNNQEKEPFLLELLIHSESMSRDLAVDQIEKKHEDVFESLQPPHNLETLSLRNYLGKQLPSWFSMDVNFRERLKEVNLYHCVMLKVLIHLPVVEHMSLEGLRSLEEWSAGDDERAATFPRLKTLKMDDCPNIKLLPFLPVVVELRLTRLPKCEGWPKPVEMPNLRKRYVRDCPHLSRFPWMSFDGDTTTGLGNSSSMIGVARESPLLPSSSVGYLKLYFQNAREKFRVMTHKLVRRFNC
ncbi:unnamed protein product [Victoria cruziana]